MAFKKDMRISAEIQFRSIDDREIEFVNVANKVNGNRTKWVPANLTKIIKFCSLIHYQIVV